MSNKMTLSAKLDAVASQKLMEDLQALRGTDVILDAGETTQMGTLGLQTILVAARSWQSDGKTLKLENLSEDATAQIATLGLTQSMLEATGSS